MVIYSHCLQTAVENVTEHTRNPFGLRPPFEKQDPGDQPAVFGYGDANADFHLIGDHPGVHGGAQSGVPFTERASSERVIDIFRTLEFVSGPATEPYLDNLFMDYIHMCCLPGGRSPTDEEYVELERYFDAELRAINAHILLPVGAVATDHVVREYTTQRHRIDLDMQALHGSELRGRGFMVIPVMDPAAWGPGDGTRLRKKLEAVLASDYRQTKGVATRVG